MPDPIIARADTSLGHFKPHPEGQHVAICVDTIDLGDRVREWQGKTRVSPTCALVFLTGLRNTDTGAFHDVHAEFAASMNERANLRHFLEQWRGRSYTDAQAAAGVPLDKLVGQWALISVEHRQSKNNRTYAKIKSIMPLPKGMPVPAIPIDEYRRADFWLSRKDAYREEVARYRSTVPPSHEELSSPSHEELSSPQPSDDEFDDFPPAPPDDDLPF
jgi:hypothetical protein